MIEAEFLVVSVAGYFVRNATSAPRGGEEVAEVNPVRVSRVGEGFSNVNANVADIFAMMVIKEDAEGVQLLQ